MKESLEERFKSFINSLDGTEFIDNLNLTVEQQEAEKADFFLHNRLFVCELKSLKTNTEEKVQKILEPYKNRPEWPVFYGPWEVAQVLRYFPDREEISKKIFEAITSSIKGLVRKANSQLRDSKRLFGLSSAGGILVITNEYIDILSPDIIADKVSELYRKRTPDNTPQFGEINITWIMSETHFIELGPGNKMLPTIIVVNPVPDPSNTTQFMSALQARWAEHNGMPAVELTGDPVRHLQFQRVSRDKSHQGGAISRQDYYAMQYRENPYLRHLGLEDLTKHFQNVLTEFIPCVLKGRTNDQNQKDKTEELLKLYIHIHEEINHRGIDIREFTSMFRELKEKMDLRNI